MSDTELKPCPFCGSKPTCQETITDGSVRCGICSASIIRLHDQHDNTGLTIAKRMWNFRIEENDINGQNLRMRDALSAILVEISSAETFNATIESIARAALKGDA